MTDRTPRVSLSEWHESLKKPVKRSHKYNAKSTVVDGKHFPSQLEAAVYAYLKNLVKMGIKSNLRLQYSVRMPSAGIGWKCDFAVDNEFGELELNEAKGFADREYVLKMKLYRAGYFGLAPLQIWKGSAAKPYVAEVIIPKQLR